MGEAHLACQYALHLWRSGLVHPSEICIMSPFKAQVRLIRSLIRSDQYGAMWEVNVGPTEAFQGLEHGVVILCVTRSRKRFVERDRALGWGVLPGRVAAGANGGRDGVGTGSGSGAGGGIRNKLNVALTRAKFGLIILGSRVVMLPDEEFEEEEDDFDDDDDISDSEDDDVDCPQWEYNATHEVGPQAQGSTRSTKAKEKEKEKELPRTTRWEEQEGTEWAQIIAFCERNGCVADSRNNRVAVNSNPVHVCSDHTPLGLVPVPQPPSASRNRRRQTKTQKGTWPGLPGGLTKWEMDELLAIAHQKRREHSISSMAVGVGVGLGVGGGDGGGHVDDGDGGGYVDDGDGDCSSGWGSGSGSGSGSDTDPDEFQGSRWESRRGLVTGRHIGEGRRGLER